MGSYTNVLKLYKPEPIEFVDVETQLNNNLNIIDEAAKYLLEYKYTDTISINSNPDLIKKTGYKYFKSYSNSHWYYNGNETVQDNRAHVDTWVSAAPYFAAGWRSVSGFPLHYCVVNSEGTIKEIHWMGRIEKTDGSAITKNIATTVLTGLPAEVVPSKTRFSLNYSGDTASNFSMTRTGFLIGGTCSIFTMGDDPPSGQRYIDFGSVKYLIGDS